jgi:hypothetical protein
MDLYGESESDLSEQYWERRLHREDSMSLDPLIATLKRPWSVVLVISSLASGVTGQKPRDDRKRPPKDKASVVEREKQRDDRIKDRKDKKPKKKPSV